MKFEAIKQNETLLVKINNIFGMGYAYYEGLVTHVTKTRFTVDYGETFKQSFTKDGNVYPREQGHIRRHVEIALMDAKAESLIRKQMLAKKARDLARKLNDIFSNANYRERIVNAELDESQIEKNILLLENTYEALKQYGPK